MIAGPDRRDSAQLTALACRILTAQGVPPAAAMWQAGLLVDAELKGQRSHGLLRLPRLVNRIRNGVADPTATGVHTWRTSAFLAVDGGQGLGPVIARTALDAAIPRVADTGVVCVTVSAANHLGMLAWYAEYLAGRGLICVALTTSEALVHPYGGRGALLGTNPIAIGVPAVPEPFVLDMATSEISMGKIHAHALAGTPLEPGWALDAAGNPTTDAEAAKAGAIAPFGGAKGYGLGLGIELLVAALTASATGTDVHGTLDETKPATKGDVFLLLDPVAAPDQLTGYLDQIRASGYDQPVLVPGDRARARRNAALREGIELPQALLDQLDELDPNRKATP
ncbi:Ldh family oxidoreductase [Streptomyces yatensis]|uniref:Ldh family oxidoreductase n=2 Tax=Streptomyces yatensis TaxID=155177 RepID=A0ABN2I3K5_9ACTN|nr:Ldh family oxidoreductase [Streptomyces yatensis]